MPIFDLGMKAQHPDHIRITDIESGMMKKTLASIGYATVKTKTTGKPFKVKNTDTGVTHRFESSYLAAEVVNLHRSTIADNTKIARESGKEVTCRNYIFYPTV